MRMRKLAGWACAGLWVWIGLCAAPQPGSAAKKKTAAPAKSKTTGGKTTAKSGSAGKSAPKKAAAKSPAKSGSATKTGVSKTASKTSSSKRGAKAAPKTTWRNRQLAPAPERYREIQEALAAKGFLNADDANGQWGASSVAALKSFQAAQNIEGNGKINSLSLIALGLGPRRENMVAPKPPEPAAAKPPEAAPTQP